MYHERQTKQMCLVHALNALLQRKVYDATTLDEICYGLNESKWFNPHKYVDFCQFFAMQLIKVVPKNL